MRTMCDLTDQQKRVLDFIKLFLDEHGYPPSVRQIGEGIGLSSSSTVHGHLSRLEEKGYIRRDPARSRAIEILGEGGPQSRSAVVHIPMLGRVAAGQPILAVESAEEFFALSADWIKGDPSEYFMLTVRGDSMIEAGILDGDLLLVRRQQTARNGEIIIALIEDEATCKRFYKEKDHIRLQPANRFMDPIIVPDCQILGKVVGVHRHFRD